MNTFSRDSHQASLALINDDHGQSFSSLSSNIAFMLKVIGADNYGNKIHVIITDSLGLNCSNMKAIKHE